MKVADFILRVRLDIGDVDGDRWEDAHIIDILNEAYTEMCNLRPDLFYTPVVVELEKGEFQQPCCCTKVKSVDAITDIDGVKVAEIRAVDSRAVSAFGKRRCGANMGYWLDGDNRFYVSPAVLPEQRIFARVTCSVKPVVDYDLSAQMPNTEYGALVDYVLFRLFGSETESATSAAKASQHYQMFFQRLGLHRQLKKEDEQQENKQ